jgi:hypothetical protein
MDDQTINLGIIEIIFLDGESRKDELSSVKMSDWRLPTEAEIEYISDIYIEYNIVGQPGWYWTNTGFLYELDTKHSFLVVHEDKESGRVILVKDL